MSRILAVDPGDVRIGLAVSDPTNTISRPLETFKHVSRQEDAAHIHATALQLEAGSIVVGVAYDEHGAIGPQARKSLRLIEALEELCSMPIIAWDESGSTQAAGRGNSKDDVLDARAAAFILQDYLNAQSP